MHLDQCKTFDKGAFPVFENWLKRFFCQQPDLKPACRYYLHAFECIVYQ